MSDRGVVALAAAVVVAASLSLELPLSVVAAALVVGLVGLATGRALLAGAGIVVVVTALAGSAEAGLRDLESGPVQGVATVWADPEPTAGGLRTTLRLDGRHLAALADGPAAGALADAAVGERFRIVGRRRVEGAPPAWMRARHLAGHVDVEAAEWVDGGAWPFRLANDLRATLDAGLGSLPPAAASLFTGLVVGDDRAQSEVMTARFRASGLSHLTAVSGQNIC